MNLLSLVPLMLTLNASSLPTEVVVEKPLVSPVVIHVTSFTEDSARVFAMQMDQAHSTGQDIIPIVISSYGGSVYALLEMVDIIEASKIPVATIVLGKAMSAGAVLFTCGTPGLRFAGKNSTIMIHEVSSMLAGNAQNIKMTAQEVDRLNTRLFHIMAKNAGQEEDYFLNILHEKGHADWYLTAEEAKSHNLVNFIGIPTLKTFISVSSKLVFEN